MKAVGLVAIAGVVSQFTSSVLGQLLLNWGAPLILLFIISLVTAAAALGLALALPSPPPKSAGGGGGAVGGSRAGGSGRQPLLLEPIGVPSQLPPLLGVPYVQPARRPIRSSRSNEGLTRLWGQGSLGGGVGTHGGGVGLGGGGGGQTGSSRLSTSLDGGLAAASAAAAATAEDAAAGAAAVLGVLRVGGAAASGGDEGRVGADGSDGADGAATGPTPPLKTSEGSFLRSRHLRSDLLRAFTRSGAFRYYAWLAVATATHHLVYTYWQGLLPHASHEPLPPPPPHSRLPSAHQHPPPPPPHAHCGRASAENGWVQAAASLLGGGGVMLPLAIERRLRPRHCAQLRGALVVASPMALAGLLWGMATTPASLVYKGCFVLFHVLYEVERERRNECLPREDPEKIPRRSREDSEKIPRRFREDPENHGTSIPAPHRHPPPATTPAHPTPIPR